jgi:hypothetical protein
LELEELVVLVQFKEPLQFFQLLHQRAVEKVQQVQEVLEEVEVTKEQVEMVILHQ